MNKKVNSHIITHWKSLCSNETIKGFQDQPKNHVFVIYVVFMFVFSMN